MALTDVSIKALKPKAKRYSVTDQRGLCIEVYPTGGCLWHYRYRADGKAQRVTLGRYPELTLKAARAKRDELATQVAHGRSPAIEKRAARTRVGQAVSLKQFAEQFVLEIASKKVKSISSTRRYLDKDIYPFIGALPMRDVTTEQIQQVVFRKKHAGFEAAAGQICGLLKRIFDYALARAVVTSNPVGGLPMRFVAQPQARTRALSSSEIKDYLTVVYRSNIRRQFKLALHLLLLTLARKSELLRARWSDVHFDLAEWHIPVENSKTKAAHIVYLSSHALALFEELRLLATGSELVLPGGRSIDKPFAHNTLNKALGGLVFEMPAFVVHDLRRTAATNLHEAGYSGDVIEKALNHKLGGVRGVYNRAEYKSQRQEMLQAWSDSVAALVADQPLVGSTHANDRRSVDFGPTRAR